MSKLPTSCHKSPRRNGSRGAVMVEYTFLLVFVFVPLVIGATAAGVQLMKNFQTGQSYILGSTP
jgi:Flp pilus assembly pilin Flp